MMNALIHAVVAATNENTAVIEAADAFDKAIDSTGSFSKYRIIDQSLQHKYTDIPTAVQLHTTTGRILLHRGLTTAEKEFTEQLEKIRSVLNNMSDKELYKTYAGEIDEDTTGAVKKLNTLVQVCRAFGHNTKPMMRVYDRIGCGIPNLLHLHNILRQRYARELKNKPIWIVQAIAR